jgi:hypothetical protein
VSRWVGVVGAGVNAFASVVDAGAAAASAAVATAGPVATRGASTAGSPVWLHAGPVPAALVTAIVAIIGWWVSRRLERFKILLAGDLAALTEKLKWDLAAGTERLKHELAGELAEQTRRADYVRNQIEKLYGPLAFLMESSEGLMRTSGAIESWHSNRSGETRAAAKGREDPAAPLVKYFDLIVQNNEEATSILRAKWGWLDPDDVAAASQQLLDSARFSVEVKQATRMPREFYTDADVRRDVPVCNGEFMDRVRRKLRDKQRELAGLTGAEPAQLSPPTAGAATPDR